MAKLEGKTALVLGGSRGIGAAISAHLAAEGADVAFTYRRDKDRADAVAGDIEKHRRRSLALPFEAEDVESVQGTVDQAAAWGGLHVLVNVAALFPLGEPEKFSPSDFDASMAVNVRAPFFASQRAAWHMKDGGSIITIGSHIVERTVFANFSLYALSKTALVGMTKGLARDLGPRGITVNLVHPGPIDTELNPADGPSADEISGFTALGRYGKPGEVAPTVAHLAGPGGSYITGTEISVDGGFNA